MALTDTNAASRFCTTCGAVTANGACPRCDTASAHPRGRWLRTAVAVLLATALVAATLGWAHHEVSAARGSARAADASRRAAEARLRAELDASRVAVNDLSVRVGSLEAAAKARPDPATIAAEVQPSVFTVDLGDVLGSAWVVESSGSGSRLVTNFHVVSDAWSAGRRDLRLRQEDRAYPATITKVDEGDDLALITTSEQFPALTTASGTPKVGDSVLVIGSPLGLGGTVSSGIVSALRDEEGTRYIQFSAPISPGNSGGPVVDSAGAVLGVAVAKLVADGAEGLSFAIPVNKVCEDLASC